ncbi:hypothetical protein ACJX0J_034796, partial [Zea mays]
KLNVKWAEHEKDAIMFSEQKLFWHKCLQINRTTVPVYKKMTKKITKGEVDLSVSLPKNVKSIKHHFDIITTHQILSDQFSDFFYFNCLCLDL